MRKSKSDYIVIEGLEGLTVNVDESLVVEDKLKTKSNDYIKIEGLEELTANGKPRTSAYDPSVKHNCRCTLLPLFYNEKNEK